MTIAIIQARMGSTRLPGKVLMPVNGVPLLAYQLKRVQSATCIDKVVVATTTQPQDSKISQLCLQEDVECFLGSEYDVLDRYYQCAKKYHAHTIIRLTADCPLVDPHIIDKAVRVFRESRVDYVANTVPVETSYFPDGMDVEVFSMDALTRAYHEAEEQQDREHVTFYFWKKDHGFKTKQFSHSRNYSKYRITVDYPEDYEVVSFLIQELTRRGLYGYIEEVIELLEMYPLLKAKNARYFFGIGWDTQNKVDS